MKDIISDLRVLFDELSPAIHCQKNGYSTNEIKNAFSRLAKEYGYISAPNGGDSEFLYDIIWYKNNSNVIQSLYEMPLIVESEWDKRFNCIKYDFEKLLIAKAEYKIMIFQTDGDIEETVIKLKEIVNNYSMVYPYEKYIFAGFVNSKGRFVVSDYSRAEHNN